jgi:hypothetical protein
MRTTVWLALVVSLCAMPLIAAEDDPLTGSRWWAEKTDSVSRATKAAYVTGFFQRFQMDCVEEKENHISLLICPSNGIFESDSINAGQIVTGVETFYKDSRNLRVPVAGAVEYVIFSLDGTLLPDPLLNYLNELRRRSSK